MEEYQGAVMAQWYKVVVRSAHQHSPGKDETHNNYAWAENPIEAIDKVKKVRGWTRKGSEGIQEVRQLSEQELIKLQELIVQIGIPEDELKKTGINGNRRTERIE